jgi:hypothetical protein
MTGTGRRLLAAGCATAAIAADIGAVIAMVAIVNAPGGPDLAYRLINGQTIGGLVLGATFSIVGWLIASRRPGNAVGWIFLAIGLSQAIDTLATASALLGLQLAPGSVPFAAFMSWVAGWAWVPGFSLLLTLAVLLFPDGHLPSARWRPVAWGSVGILAMLAIPIAVVSWPHQGIALVADDPAASLPDVAAVENLTQAVGLSGLLALAVLSVIGLVVRFRRSRGIERQQLKWFTWAGMVEIGVLMTSAYVNLEQIPGTLLAIVVTPLLPIAATIAIFRYRLYDIDRIVSRTLAYGALTAVLVAVYGLGFLVLQGALAPFTNGRPVAVAASTLAAFALIQPLRRRIQGVVDRSFYRYRYDAEHIVAALADRLRSEMELGALRAELTDTARSSLGPTQVGVWIRHAPGSVPRTATMEEPVTFAGRWRRTTRP